MLATYAYDDLGRRTSATLGNGAATTWAYDAVSRLSGLTFDPSGTADDLTITYAHDPAGGIVQRTLSDGDYGFAPVTGSTSYQNDGLNRVTSAGGTAVTYDGAENAVTAPGTPTLTFDGLNRLATAGGVSLGYEPLGRLYQIYAGATDFTSLIHAGDQLAAEYDHDQGLLLRRHVPGAGLDDVVATVAADGTRTWLTGDERGSVMALTNASGAVTQINAWDEYGVPRPGNAGTFQYAGQMWLGFANLQHSRARVYDPTLGRFRQTDPIGYAAGANLYAYVGGDPVNFVDPMGLCPDAGRPECDIVVTGCRNLGKTYVNGRCVWRDQIDDVIITNPRYGRGPGGSGRVGGGLSAFRQFCAAQPARDPVSRFVESRASEIVDGNGFVGIRDTVTIGNYQIVFNVGASFADGRTETRFVSLSGQFTSTPQIGYRLSAVAQSGYPFASGAGASYQTPGRARFSGGAGGPTAEINLVNLQRRVGPRINRKLKPLSATGRSPVSRIWC